VFAENRARAAELRALATALDLEQTVTFVGPRDDMPQVMDALDVLVAASSIEACSRAVLEAMATGTPVVAARAGGNPELVEAGASGLLFAPESAEDLAGVLELLIVDLDRRRAMGAAARARAVEHFGIGKQVAAIEAVYTAVLDER
jgi:glycosyltransferase involved in cell wall biosynthesis